MNIIQRSNLRFSVVLELRKTPDLLLIIKVKTSLLLRKIVICREINEDLRIPSWKLFMHFKIERIHL